MKECFSGCLVGLALAALAADSGAAGRAALVIGNAAHREVGRLSNTGFSHDGFAQKSPFTTKPYKEPGPDVNVALGHAPHEAMRLAADRHDFFVYSSPAGSTAASVFPADSTDAASARRHSMEVEMKTGHQKRNKRDTQLDSTEGAQPRVMFPKTTDKDLQNVEPQPGKVYRRPARPGLPKTESDNR